jgi:hypothetical protein
MAQDRTRVQVETIPGQVVSSQDAVYARPTLGLAGVDRYNPRARGRDADGPVTHVGSFVDEDRCWAVFKAIDCTSVVRRVK